MTIAEARDFILKEGRKDQRYGFEYVYQLLSVLADLQPQARELAGRLIDGEVQPGETMRIVALLERVAALGESDG